MLICLATGYDSRFHVYKAKQISIMSTTISLSRRNAVTVRISRTTAAVALAAVCTVSTFIGLAIDADILTYLSATAAIAAVYSLEQKGGDR